MPYPNGITDINTRNLIDFNEAGIFVETTNRGREKAYTGVRIQEPGPYDHSEKYTLLMAIAERAGFQDWLVHFEADSGTTVSIFYEFILDIIEQIGPGTPGNREPGLYIPLQVRGKPA